MSTVTFDTMEGARKLREAGFDEKQAEAVVRVLADAQNTLATKSDLSSLRDHVDAKFDKLQWMIGFLIALAVTNFAKQFF